MPVVYSVQDSSGHGVWSHTTDEKKDTALKEFQEMGAHLMERLTGEVPTCSDFCGHCIVMQIEALKTNIDQGTRCEIYNVISPLLKKLRVARVCMASAVESVDSDSSGSLLHVKQQMEFHLRVINAEIKMRESVLDSVLSPSKKIESCDYQTALTETCGRNNINHHEEEEVVVSISKEYLL